MTPGDQFQRQFGFADTGIAGDQDAHAENVHEHAMKVDRFSKARRKVDP